MVALVNRLGLGLWVWSAMLVCVLSASRADGQMPAASVAVARAEIRPVPRVIEVVGSVEPVRRSIIGAEVAGLVAQMPVREGDWVEAGQLLCQLRDVSLRLGHRQAVAALGQLQARLDELRTGTRQTELRRLKAEMEEARATLDKWERELKRIRGLYEKTSASVKEYNDTYSDHAAATQRFAMAAARYDEGVEGPRPEEIAQAEQAVAAQQAVVDRLADQLAQTQIRAPYTGSVARLGREVAEWVPEGGEVVELIDLETVLVRVDVPESAISGVETGQPVWVYFDALKERLEGHVRHIIPQADRAARSFPVEIAFANADHHLLAGMFGRATIPLGQSEPQVVVPKDAIMDRQGTGYVVAVMETAEGVMGIPTAVTRGASVDQWVAITSGNVAPGTEIVVRGNESIMVPTPVQVVPAEQLTGLPATTQPADLAAQQPDAAQPAGTASPEM